MKSEQFLFKVGNGMGIFSDDMDYTSDFSGYDGFSDNYDISEIENGGWSDEYDYPFDYEEIYGFSA